MIKSFDHVAIAVKDFDGTINWYVKNLGFTVKSSVENKERGTRIAFLETNGQAVLEFFGYIDSSKVTYGPTLKAEETGIRHISFFVDDMEKICQKLKDANVEFTSYTPKRSVIKDPNGILVELRLL